MRPTDWPLLIDVETLEALLDDPDLRLFDCRFSLADPDAGLGAYRDGHLPGARYAHLDIDLSSPIGPGTGRHPLPHPRQLADWLGRCGVGPRSRVVVYDDLGGAFAVRLWWLMRWIGHDRAALLNGGIQAWTASGRVLTRDAPEHEPDILEPRPDDQLWVTSTALSAALLTTDVDARIQVIDARAPERFRGEQEPIDPMAGHIPSAVNLPLSGNLDATGRFLSAAQLHARFAEAIGELPPSRVAHSCGSGVNACHNLLAMELAGLTGSRLYAGSWSEWIQDPARPVALGDDNAHR